VRTLLTETGLNPRCPVLELIETFLMQDSKSTVAVLRVRNGIGLHVALDSLGTGYSSLRYLMRIPIDTLKIDHSFVRDLATDADNASSERSDQLGKESAVA
jgi:EAL domain-containing protein (putative c-di-GMP-specific phosphodiesterase class I)